MSDKSKASKAMTGHDKAVAHGKATGHPTVGTTDWWWCDTCKAGNRPKENGDPCGRAHNHFPKEESNVAP